MSPTPGAPANPDRNTLDDLRDEYDALDKKIRRQDGQIAKNAAREDIERHRELALILKNADEKSDEGPAPQPAARTMLPPRDVKPGTPVPQAVSQKQLGNAATPMSFRAALQDVRDQLVVDPAYTREEHKGRLDLAIKSIDQAMAAIDNCDKQNAARIAETQRLDAERAARQRAEAAAAGKA